LEVLQKRIIFAAIKKAIKMRNVDYLEEQELEVMDFAPTTPEEAHLRIEEAERGIANGEVVLHADVMKHSYELLQRYGS
jgi:hypothetical protein